MESEDVGFRVHVVAVLEEAQFLSHYFSPPKQCPVLLADHESVLPGKRLHAVAYQHAHGQLDTSAILAEGTAALDSRLLLLLAGGGAFRAGVRRGEGGRIEFAPVGETAAGRSLTKEQGTALAVEEMAAGKPHSDTVREKVVAVARVETGGVVVVTRTPVKLFDEEDRKTPVALLSNHSKGFSRWFELYLEMLLSGARRSVIVFHQKMQIVRFEYYDFAVVESMCEAEIAEMKSTLAERIRTIARQVEEEGVLYEARRVEGGVLEVVRVGEYPPIKKPI